jgi:hypothetical protein
LQLSDAWEARCPDFRGLWTGPRTGHWSVRDGRAKNRRASYKLKFPRTLNSPTLMSLTTTSDNFQSILDAALDSYTKQTGIDLTKHPSADKLKKCRSPDDVLQILSERESAFKDYRDQHRKLIDRLRPVVQVIHAFSAVLGEAAGLVRLNSPYLIVYLYASQQVPFQPTKAIFVGVDVLLSVYILFFRSFHHALM